MSTISDEARAAYDAKEFVTWALEGGGLKRLLDEHERMEERIRFDLEYIRNWSPWLDIKIIFLTVWTMARGDENAY